ncbi:acyltransferase [Microlunatus elymi]|uniref:Acyltransferase n=1 Tax=Microlunatus elymi TaxID=2596828 RepID=A0A516PVM3_9ACTN|nr:acyltransferase [Microlunatus elymi]QDP95172.1 acyltransferase [Microlunatus elymi]
MSRSTAVLNSLATKVKGSSYMIDARIPITGLTRIAAERAAMRTRAIAIFGRRGATAFVGQGARVWTRGQVRFGPGTTFGHGSLVDAMSTDGVTFGRNVSVGRNTRIECTGNLQQLGRGITVGDNVGLGTDCLYGCAGGIEIGDDCLVGNYVTFHSENHVADRRDIPIRLQGVRHAGIRVGKDCWIGAKATVLDGANIGDGCVIAAGAVVTAGDYAPYGIYGGVPARLLRYRDDTG